MPHLPTLLLQIGVILIVARTVGFLFRRINQPQVVGEMVAGILIGPSVLGWLAPGLSNALFPPASLGFLSALSQIGVLAFMFVVGLELNPQLMKGRGHTAVVTSHASIMFPFLLGSILALYLYPRVSDDSVTFTGFALFLGIAMSITAFPVLARILQERRLMNHPVGAIALACAAVDDVTAWCILAAVIVIVRASHAAMPLWLTIGGAAGFGLVMWFVARPLFRGLERVYQQRGKMTQNLLALILLLVFASAWLTETLGIHALFGAFVAGAVMPKGSGFVKALTERLEDIVVVLFLPLFFAFTGLRMTIGVVSGSEMWFYCGLIIVVAVVGKLVGSMLAARFTGLGWRESAAIGALMNTRGLIQLVVLNIGLDIGVISPALFAMMVLMALVTTFMTTPLLAVIYPRRLVEQTMPRPVGASGQPQLEAAGGG
ncbi:MAG TPA: cation:proton antiporter [Gemmatimonadales bacterium]|jgi:Kef-type K+ transport system membrane component KefB|nr:cation:proton antiporter [Gemmatimonadales bacterium]